MDMMLLSVNAKERAALDRIAGALSYLDRSG
jgi:hypothetical protein